MRKQRKIWFNEYDDKFAWLVEKSKANHGLDLTLFTELQKQTTREYLDKFQTTPDGYELIKVLHVISIHSEPKYIDEYLNAKSNGDIRTIIKLTKGDDALTLYNDKIMNARKTQLQPWNNEYWLNKGYTHDESLSKIRQYKCRLSNSIKNGQKGRRSYSDSLDNPYCEDFYTYRGYTQDEARTKIIEVKEKTSCSLESFIRRHGEVRGIEIYNNIKISRKTSVLSKYGRNNGFMPRTSKESIKFLLPIYKFCRKLGIARSDIHWGIKGSREYVVNDVKNSKIYFYDFVIPSIKICVEYHGTIWHPRGDLSLWKSPVIKDVQQKFDDDRLKENCMSNKGYDIIVVWSDCNKSETKLMIMEKIKNAINQ